MNVKFIDYGEQYRGIKEEIDTAMQTVLNNGDLILRQDVEDFEKNLANYVGTQYAVALNSGSDALYFSLKALGIGAGDEVITVSYTFCATIEAIGLTGAKPVLVDVGDDYLMNVDKIEEAITDKTKAIIPVHLAGKMCNMKMILDIATRYNLKVVEDSAQSLGASKSTGWVDGEDVMIKRAGAWGNTGCFSFYPAKILGCYGDAGAITTNDEEIRDKVLLYRDHGYIRNGNDRFKKVWGWNSRMDNLQASVLNVKIKYLDEAIKRRREVAIMYIKSLQDNRKIGLPQFITLLSGSKDFDVFQDFYIRVENRDEFCKYLKEKGIEVLTDSPITNHKAMGLDYDLPNTDKIVKETVRLPIAPPITNEEVEYVIKTIKDFYKEV